MIWIWNIRVTQDVYRKLVMNLMIWNWATAWDVGVMIWKLILEKYRNAGYALLKAGCEQGEVAGFLIIMEFMKSTFNEGKEFNEFFTLKWYENQSKLL